jgi:hypothetical protein
MGDDRHHRLRLRAVYASRRRARLQVLNGLEAIGHVGEPEVGDLGFEVFTAHVTMGPPILWGSYNDMRPMFEQLEVMGDTSQTYL